MRIRIVCPVSCAYEGDAAFVSIPSTDGEFGVLPAHSSEICTIDRGYVRVSDKAMGTVDHTWTSEISGTFCSVVLPGARSVAAMSLSAEFLAPETGTEPPMAWPPSTRIISKVYPFKKHARGGQAIPGMMCSQMVER